jgi:hypothetical protein
MSALPTTSGTFNFKPAFSDWIVECYERIQIGSAALDDPKYIISARRSANLICLDLAANRGANLWLIGDETLNVPLVAGQASYPLPDNTISLFDVYLRQYTPDLNFQVLGFSPQVMTQANGEPVLTALGEPMLIAPGVDVFSVTAGDQFVTMNWPAHGLLPGFPIFFQMPVTAGAMTLTGFAIVSEVLDSDNLKFLAPTPSRVTHVGTGGTPLFVSHGGLPNVTVVLPGHGLTAGTLFPIQIPVAVGGFLLVPGLYTINEVLTPFSFNIFSIPSAPLQPGLFLLSTPTSGLGTQALGDVGNLPLADFTQTVYENGGQLLVSSQSPGVLFEDTMLWPLSRNDYAVLPDKFGKGRPSVYWYDRSIDRNVNLWLTPQDGSTWGFIAYRMRHMQDVELTVPIDMPRRFFPAFCSLLTGYLAEKFKPEVFADKMMKGEADWERAANADREMVSSYIVPDFSRYTR